MSSHRRRGARSTAHAWFATVRGRLAVLWAQVDRPALSLRDNVAALVLTVGLVAAALVGLISSVGPGTVTALPPTPRPPVSASVPAPVTTSPAAGVARAKAPTYKCSGSHAEAAGGDVPSRVCIPSLGVSATVLSLGLNADHTVQVPTLAQVRDAGWYKYSAVPGDVGPTVILGHIDSAQYGEGVFFKLARLRAGDQVEVTRGDGRIAVFRIDTVREVSKKAFPTADVYGATSGPALRLVTCGGAFDANTGSYLDNIIAFGTLLHLTSPTHQSA
jgi:sortase (surface protein transpeptidase)